jgi:hypothetical protein
VFWNMGRTKIGLEVTRSQQNQGKDEPADFDLANSTTVTNDVENWRIESVKRNPPQMSNYRIEKKFITHIFNKTINLLRKRKGECFQLSILPFSRRVRILKGA